MKSNCKLSTLVFIGCSCLFFGCTSYTVPRVPAGSAVGSVHSGAPNTLTVSEFAQAGEALANKMLADDVFLGKYNELVAVKGEGELPVILVQSFTNATSARIQDRIDDMVEGVRIKVRRSGQFDFKEDKDIQRILDRINLSADVGLESGDILSSLKTHATPDYILTGTVKAFSDRDVSGDTVNTYRLYMRLIDFSSKTGKGGTIVWEDRCTIEK